MADLSDANVGEGEKNEMARVSPQRQLGSLVMISLLEPLDVLCHEGREG